MSLPGMPGGQYTAEGLEKLESGAPDYQAETHARNFEKRARKLANALDDYYAWQMFETFGTPDAPVAIVGWGSTIGPVREAVTRAESEGMPVAVLYPKMLFPLPTAEPAHWRIHPGSQGGHRTRAQLYGSVRADAARRVLA
jgi:2-oxoglutarate ferredoxin oxidoreductase subunit alpha